MGEPSPQITVDGAPVGLPSRIVTRVRRDVPLVLLDALIVVPAYLIPLTLRFSGGVPQNRWRIFWLFLPVLVLIHLLCNYLFGLYGQMWRYASVQERMLPGLQPDDRILTNIEILSLKAVPARLVIIGAGAVGIEFASMFRRFGTEVTVLEMLPRVVPVEDEEISRELEKSLKKQKINICTSARVERVEKTSAGVKVSFTSTDGKLQALEADKVLVAVGRRAVTDNMNLEKTRIQMDRGFIKTDGYMRTEEPNVYAIGDIVLGTPQLAHVASMEGLVAVAHIAGKPASPIDYTRVPNCTYCEPQVASVGMTEQAAREKDLRYKVGKFPFVGNSKATILGSHEGFIKMIADEKDGSVLGVHMIGPGVTELVGEVTLGMSLHVAADEIMETIHAHPTLHEAILDAANSVYGLTINA